MEVFRNSEKSKQKAPNITLFLGLFFLSGLIACSLFFGAGLVLRNQFYHYLSSYLQDHGLVMWQGDSKISELLRVARDNYLNNKKNTENPLPTESLELNIKFKHLHRLHESRENAMARGILVAGDKDMVPAEVSHRGRKVRVRLRLKGDLLDHLRGNKWSFRIKVKGDDHILGMRVFSLQHPRTRGYHREAVFYRHLKHYGVLTPRYTFVRLRVNGDDLGIMALEEHFSKELLESQNYREGVIVRFDETDLWQSRAENKAVDYHWWQAYIKPFRTNKTMSSAVLKNQYQTAVGLLRGFAHGELKASEVFDKSSMARFIALSEVWDAYHALIWHNVRFYFNPITGRLMPIAFDASLQAVRERHEDLMLVNSADKGLSFVNRVLADSSMYEVFVSELHKVSYEFPKLQPGLKQFASQLRAQLDAEFSFLTPIAWSRIGKRAELLREIDPSKLLSVKRQQRTLQSYGTPVVWLVEDEKNKWIEIEGAAPFHLLSVFTKENSKEKDIAFSKISNKRKVAAVSPNRDWYLESYRVHDSVGSLWVRIKDTKGVPIERRALLYGKIRGPLGTTQTSFPHFFEQIEGGYAVKVVSWTVRSPVHFQSGEKLVVPAGTRLSFADNSYLSLKGPLIVEGSQEKPVEFTPLHEHWGGILISQSTEVSRIKYLRLKGLIGFQTADAIHDACVVFYESAVDISNLSIDGCSAEDGLNIFRSNFTLVDSNILNTESDALDADFSRGKIRGSRFESINGDGIDFSGSQVEISETHFQKVKDKAISVGEGSQAVISKVSIVESGTGVASKDLSKTQISDSQLNNIRHVGLMAYIKKPEYGPGQIVARNVEISSQGRDLIAARGSEIIVDGKRVKAEDVDIDSLYKKGFMRKRPNSP